MPVGMELRIFPYETQKKKDLGIQQNKKRRNEFEDMGGEGEGGRGSTNTEEAQQPRRRHTQRGTHKSRTGRIRTIQRSSQVF